MEVRIPTETVSLTNASEVLALKGLSFVKNDDLDNFGNHKLKPVVDHYGSSKVKSDGRVIEAVIDAHEAVEEWKLLKQTIMDDPSLSLLDLYTMWQMIAAMFGKQLLNLVKLAKIVLVFLLQTTT